MLIHSRQLHYLEQSTKGLTMHVFVVDKVFKEYITPTYILKHCFICVLSNSTIQKKGTSCISISTSMASLLNVTLNIFSWYLMDNLMNVSAINAHPKCAGCYDNSQR